MSDVDAVVREVRSLAEAQWFRGVYRRIYEVIAIEGRLPSPSNIYVATRLDGELPSSVLGFRRA